MKIGILGVIGIALIAKALYDARPYIKVTFRMEDVEEADETEQGPEDEKQQD